MTNEPRFQDASWVRAAFPAALRPVAAEVARALAPQVDPRIGSAYTASPHIVPVQLDGESIAFPYRIYHGVLPAGTSFVMTLSPVVAACAYTRHHDGHVRQKAVRTLLDGRCALQPWVVPYVVKLVDEYVVEIVEDVAAFLTEVDVEGSPQQRTYGRVLAQNPEMLRLLRARAASYWDCYYRWRYRRLEEYPGRRLALALSRAAALEKASWPPPRP